MNKIPWIVMLAMLSLAVVAQEPETAPEEAPPGVEAVEGQGEDEDGAEDGAAAAEDAPDAEALAEAAAAAGGEIGEVEEEFTPEDEISEDYPVPLPADI